MECEENNPKVFWKLLNSLRNKKKENHNPIELDKWTSYFNKLHNTPIGDNTDTDFQKKIIKNLEMTISMNKYIEEFDKNFTFNEIEEGIKHLKMRKASGLDAISNEMLKAGINTL